MNDRQEIKEALIREIESLRESEQKWRQWFEDAPISLWEQDYSEVKRRVDEIRDRGVGDLEAYFQSHPDLCRELAALVRVVDVNKFTVRLYRARSKEDFFAGITRVFSGVSYEGFVANLMAVAARLEFPPQAGGRPDLRHRPRHHGPQEGRRSTAGKRKEVPENRREHVGRGLDNGPESEDDLRQPLGGEAGGRIRCNAHEQARGGKAPPGLFQQGRLDSGRGIGE